jgi:hypothetical protein
MKKFLVALVFLALSLPCRAQYCEDSVEYKESVAIAEAAWAEKLGQIRDFLMKTRGLDADQAAMEIARSPTPGTAAYEKEATYEKALEDIVKKISSMDPWTMEKCADLIKLQRRYNSVIEAFFQFRADSIMGRQAPEPVVADDPERP